MDSKFSPLATTIAEQLELAFDGAPWHGPSLTDILLGITAEQAASCPIAGGHAIWDLVLHLTTWNMVVLRRLDGSRFDVNDELDWPRATDLSERSWQEAVQSMRDMHQQLCAALRLLTEPQLDVPVQGRGHTVRTMVLGVLQHNVYHSGQIALLKKAL